MKPVTTDNFGLLIAYLLPGFVALWGLRPFVTGWPRGTVRASALRLA